jgi:type IV secretory pathway VirB3-like protein
MRTTVIYSTLTKPELFFGLAKESLVVIAAVTMLFIFFKENFGYSILYLIPILGVVYGLLWSSPAPLLNQSLKFASASSYFVSTSNDAKDSGENTTTAITAITAIKVHTVIVVMVQKYL